MSIEIKPYKPEYDDQEIEIRCKLCAYKLTDIEKELYRKLGERGAYCTFCFAEKPYPVGLRKILYWKIFTRLDWQIHSAKKTLRKIFYESADANNLKSKMNYLLGSHFEELFPSQYSEEKNKYQLKYEKYLEDYTDLRRDAKFIYYNLLSDLGVLYSRQLSKEKKKKLLYGLKQAIKKHKGEYHD